MDTEVSPHAVDRYLERIDPSSDRDNAVTNITYGMRVGAKIKTKTHNGQDQIKVAHPNLKPFYIVTKRDGGTTVAVTVLAPEQVERDTQADNQEAGDHDAFAEEISEAMLTRRRNAAIQNARGRLRKIEGQCRGLLHDLIQAVNSQRTKFNQELDQILAECPPEVREAVAAQIKHKELMSLP